MNGVPRDADVLRQPVGPQPATPAGDHAEVGVLGLRGGGRVGRGRASCRSAPRSSRRCATTWCDAASGPRRACFASRAWSGNSSQMSMPGTAVRIGRNGPRISAGASGFGSNVSNWLGPPHIQKRMTDVRRRCGIAPGANSRRERQSGERGRGPDAEERSARDRSRAGSRHERLGRGRGQGGRRSAGRQVYHGELASGNGLFATGESSCRMRQVSGVRMSPFTPQLWHSDPPTQRKPLKSPSWQSAKPVCGAVAL